jgi:hypothetical protein
MTHEVTVQQIAFGDLFSLDHRIIQTWGIYDLHTPFDKLQIMVELYTLDQIAPVC